jgi:hypothetical protein
MQALLLSYVPYEAMILSSVKFHKAHRDPGSKAVRVKALLRAILDARGRVRIGEFGPVSKHLVSC